MGVVMVRLAGAFAVSVVGSGAEINVGSRKARVLLALLASRRGRAVPLDEIVDVLWVEQRPRRPHREVATLVSRLRGRLGRDVVVGVRLDIGSAVRLRWSSMWTRRPGWSWTAGRGSWAAMPDSLLRRVEAPVICWVWVWRWPMFRMESGCRICA